MAKDTVREEITQLVQSIVGKLNSFDSKSERAEVTDTVVNGIFAGVELSKIEKAGIMAYVMDKRVKG